MDEMFATYHTVSPNTINSIFKKNNADKHFHFRDYATAVSNRNLTGGITGLFTSLSGSNFSGQKGFTTDTDHSYAKWKWQLQTKPHTRNPIIGFCSTPA
jgi:hypothetical protein